jgi:hypothetical protein
LLPERLSRVFTTRPYACERSEFISVESSTRILA